MLKIYKIYVEVLTVISGSVMPSIFFKFVGKKNVDATTSSLVLLSVNSKKQLLTVNGEDMISSSGTERVCAEFVS